MTTARARRSSRACMVLLGVGLGPGLLTSSPFTAPAQAAGCSASQIAVVVSFNELGGGTQTACIDDVDTGLQALAAAGYTVTPVAGAPFVCRINDVPAADPCQRTPPATAYWAYWTAPMGGTAWSYSTVGAGSQDPEPGQAQGWSFGADAEPAIAPPEADPNSVGASADSDSSNGASAQDRRPPSVPDAGTPWAVYGTIAGAAALAGAGYLQRRRSRNVPPVPDP